MEFHSKHSSVEMRSETLRIPCEWLVLALSCFFFLLPAFGQNPRFPQSDLARENMEHVGAPAAEIEAVLRDNPGLMIELKRWIAKDATDHGQLVSESDLTREAIYLRLEHDLRFRSAATLILQRFGYLVPQVNPNSAQGKQQALLIEERAKWLAQEQEQQSLAAQHTERTAAAQSVPSPPVKSPRPSREREREQGGSSYRPPPSPQISPAETLPQLEEAAEIPVKGNSTGTQGSEIGQANGLNKKAPELSNFSLSDPTENAQEKRTFKYAREQNQAATVEAHAVPSVSFTSGQSLIREPDPYVNVPSLYDMYLQSTPQPRLPERFGIEVFQNGTSDQQHIPFDLPVGPNYVVGPGDSLAIDVWGGVSQRLFRTVDREGRLSLPQVGPLFVAGKSLAQVQQAVQTSLRSQFRDVSADVSLSRLRTVRVYVVGDVVHPGAYDVSSLATPLNALFAAGGPTAQGSLRIIDHERGKELVQQVDVYDLLLRGVKTGLKRLENGDTVVIPTIGPQVTVEGMVRRPAIYELHNEESLADVLSLAGGLLPTASLRHIEVQRVIAHQKRTMLSLNIPDGTDPQAVTAQLESFRVQGGDKIRIFPIAPYNQNSVYLEGHVLYPGEYSYHPGMRVTDLIPSYKALLPEPAKQYAEIIRLERPGYHPVVKSFNLGEVLSHPASAPLLEPLDTLQIFGRYDFENLPTVSVLGDVRAPGIYRTSGQLRLSDAIHLAGGLAPDAETRDAQIFRYRPDGDSEVFSVDLAKGLSGNPADDIVLKPRDRILVHRNPAFVKPASVYIEGEVAHPGRYPLARNMDTADLIRAAGGLQPGADTQRADLTQYKWDGTKRIVGSQKEINLSAAMSSKNHSELSDGAVLTIRQLPGWDDLGAIITVRGEVVHPGKYGIRPGEKLSSILRRAGGFMPNAYPYGAILERQSVRALQASSQQELMERITAMQTELELKPTTTDPNAKIAEEAAYGQWQQTLQDLANSPPLGRITIQISSNIRSWAHTSRDLAVQNGDTLIIPEGPSYVLVQGQVYNPTAVGYWPGKSAKWYLKQSGGPTNLANKRAIFVVRADGTVIGGHGYSLWMSGGLDQALQPGDAVVVPERALGGPKNWQAFFQVIQVMTGVTTSAILAAKY